MRPDPVDEERFAERYAASGAAAVIETELEALGSDYQANGYTTRDQADELGRLLALGSDTVLLDIGAGCGWPGLYLAGESGCRVVSADPVAEGVDTARRRALADGLSGRSAQILTSATHLPLRPRSIDAVVHTDVLC